MPDPVMPAKQVQKVLRGDHSVRVPGNRRRPLHILELRPVHAVDVEDLHLVEAAVAVEASEHVELALDPVQGVAGPGCRLVPGYGDFEPVWLDGVEDEQVVQPLVAVVAAVDVDFVAVGRRSVVVPRDGEGACRQNF